MFGPQQQVCQMIETLAAPNKMYDFQTVTLG